MSRRVLLVIMTAILLLCCAHVSYAYESPALEQAELESQVLEEVMNYLYKYHLDRPGVDILVDGALDGMLRSIGDPYTEYFSNAELDNFTNSLDGNLFGIGVVLKPVIDSFTIENVVPGSPAEKSGIRAGDVIVAVDDLQLTRLDFEMAIDKIRGPLNSKVRLRIKRPGKGTMDFVITRGKIDLPTVEYSQLQGRVGYIVVSSFGEKTKEEFENAFGALMLNGINSLILDLRDNAGGYLQAAIELASEFLPAGSRVVSIVDREGNQNQYATGGVSFAGGLPLAVLVNENSASAAEVLAGALKDHERAKLIGVKTYGKGLLQTIIPLVNGGALKITTHRYFTPAGTSLDMMGLVPDRQVTLPELQLVAAWQELCGQDYRLEYVLSQKKAYINGIEAGCTANPVTVSGHMLVPLRFTLEALGYQVHSFDEGIKIYGNNNIMEVYPGRSKVLFNDAVIAMENPVQIWEGACYIPVGCLKLLDLDVKEEKDKICIFAA